MNDNNKKNNHRKAKIITMIIIIIIIILLLITSCTSGFWGRIGGIFNNEVDYDIDSDSNDGTIHVNQYLNFNRYEVELSLSADNAKLGFTVKNINPDEFTCTTSDANIAICYVKDDYVVIVPKGTGKVDVTLETKVNGETYRTVATAQVEEQNRSIKLGRSSATLDLYNKKDLLVSIVLERLTGDITVEVDNKDILDAKIVNGSLKLTGKKTGKTKVTVSVEYQNQTYSATLNVTVVDSTPSSTPVKNSDSTLKSLKSSAGNLKFNSNTKSYYLSVSSDTDKLTLDAIPNSSKAQIEYYFNGNKVNGLNNLPLKEGSNKVTIIVTAEDGTKTTYEIEIEKSKKQDTTPDNYLKSLKTSKGTLTPEFAKDVTSYHVSVDNTTDKLTITAEKANKNAKTKYYFNGEEVSSLKDLPLKTGDNVVEIEVTDENNHQRTYQITITKEASHDNTLTDLEVESSNGDHLNEDFNSDKLDYTMDVPFDRDILSFNAFKSDSKSNVTYKFNGQSVKNLKDLQLKFGRNDIEIVVESEDGNTRTYNVQVYRAERKIELSNKFYNVYENEETKIEYDVYEYDRYSGNWYLIDDYDIDDLNIQFNGTIKKEKGYLTINPTTSEAGNSYDLNVEYGDYTSKAKVNVLKRDYYVKSEKNNYEFNTKNGGSIILDTNLFTGTPKVSKTKDGIIICDSNNPELCIEITGDVTITYDEGTDSLALHITSKEEGKHKVHIKGSAFGTTIDEYDIEVNIIVEYFITLDSNGGYFDGLDKPTILNLKVQKGESLNLRDYQAYKEDLEDDCLQYELIGYGEEPDTTIDDSDFYELSEIIITNDITLYAIYSEDKVTAKPEDKWIYLDTTDEETQLFHNEEYYKAYGIDKMIYPGAKGTYLMHLDNNSGKDIVIKKIVLTEVKTICIDEERTKCINMGYKIKSKDKYYYGNDSSYTILHKNTNETTTMELNVPNNTSIDILLSWEWVDIDDEIDTAIGNSVTDINNEYALLVGINYTSIPVCG